jgi:uncharacterized protein (DUF2164 family)
MPITVPPDKKKQILDSIKRYARENLDQEIGDLQAGLLLEFVLKEIAPTVYNQAIADAQAYMRGRLDDLEGVCFEKEFDYWTPPPRRQPR